MSKTEEAYDDGYERGIAAGHFYGVCDVIIIELVLFCCMGIIWTIATLAAKGVCVGCAI